MAGGETTCASSRPQLHPSITRTPPSVPAPILHPGPVPLPACPSPDAVPALALGPRPSSTPGLPRHPDQSPSRSCPVAPPPLSVTIGPAATCLRPGPFSVPTARPVSSLESALNRFKRAHGDFRVRHSSVRAQIPSPAAALRASCLPAAPSRSCPASGDALPLPEGQKKLPHATAGRGTSFRFRIREKDSAAVRYPNRATPAPVQLESASSGCTVSGDAFAFSFRGH